MRNVTERQLMVLACIHNHVLCLGYPPTIREMQDGLGIGTIRGITGHVGALERKGCLQRKPFTARGIRITDYGRALLAVHADNAQRSIATSSAGSESSVGCSRPLVVAFSSPNRHTAHSESVRGKKGSGP